MNPCINTLKKIGRMLSDEQIPTSEIPFRSFNHTLNDFQCRNSHPLVVILSTDAEAKDSLQELSRTTRLTGPTWLMFSGDATEFLTDINIPFDCEFLIARQDGLGEVTLTEMYNVAENMPLQYYCFGSWTSQRNHSFTDTPFYLRRSSLHGLTIPAATIENPPITVIETKDDRVTIEGYFGKVWQILEKKMNFKTNFSFPEDGGRGSVLTNGTANGMIRMIQDKEVHVAVDAFGMSGIRATAVDFTVPLLSTRYCVLIRSPDSLNLHWDNFLAPFSLMLWIAMMATVLVIAVHLTLLYYLGQRYGNQEAEEIKFYTFSDSLLLVLGIFCQQGHESTPKSYSCRFVCVSTYIIAVLVFGTYSATFISFLAVHDNRLPYTDLQSLLVHGNYKFGTVSGHAVNYISENSRNFLNRTPHDSYRDMIERSVLDGMEQVCRSRYAYLIPLETALAFKNKVSCTVVPLPDETSLYIPQGMAIAKNSPYRGLFNYNLNGLRANGVLHKQRVNENTRNFAKKKKQGMWTRVGLEEVGPIIGFLLAGVLASTVVLFLEKSTPIRLMAMQRRRGVFCCVANMRYLDTGNAGPSSNDNLSSRYLPEVSASSLPRHTPTWRAEDNQQLTDIQQLGLSHIV